MFDLNTRKLASILALTIVGSLVMSLAGFALSRFKNETLLNYIDRYGNDIYIWASFGAAIFGLAAFVYFIFPIRKR
jgi:hypothetical protein